MNTATMIGVAEKIYESIPCSSSRVVMVAIGQYLITFDVGALMLSDYGAELLTAPDGSPLVMGELKPISAFLEDVIGSGEKVVIVTPKIDPMLLPSRQEIGCYGKMG